MTWVRSIALILLIPGMAYAAVSPQDEDPNLGLTERSWLEYEGRSPADLGAGSGTDHQNSANGQNDQSGQRPERPERPERNECAGCEIREV